jgi:hypothetical protein
MVTTPLFADEIPAPLALLRWLGRQVVIITLMLLLAAVAIISLLMVNRQEVLRRAVILHLRHALQRDVALREVTLNRRGQAVLTDLVIYEGLGSTRRLWSAKEIDLRFDPLRLTAFPKLPLSAVRSVTIIEPYAIITRDAGGRWNFDDLIKPRKPSNDRFRGKLAVRNGEVIFCDDKGLLPGGAPISEHLTELNLVTTAAGGDLLPFRVSARSDGGRLRAFTATGSLNTSGSVQAEILLGTVELAALRQYLPSSLPATLEAGQADARVQLAVAVDSATQRTTWQTTVVADVRDLRGTVTLEGRVIPGTIASGQLRYADGVVELVDLQGRLDGIPLQLDGTLANFDRPTLALQVVTQEAPTEAILALLPALRALPYAFSGKLDARARIVGTPSNLQVSGHLSGLSAGTSFGEFHEIEGDIAYTADAVQATNVTATGFGGAFAGSFWVLTDPAKGPQALVVGEVTGVGIQPLVRQFFAGELESAADPSLLRDIDGTLSGPIAIEVARGGRVTLSTRARGNVEVAGLTHGEVDASVLLDIDGDAVTTRIERLSARTPEGLFQAQGTIAPDRTVHLTVRGSGVDLAAVGAYIDQDLRGTGFLTGELDGPLDQLAFTGTLHVQDGVYAGRAFTDLYSDVQATFAPVAVTLQRTRLIAGGSQVTIPETRITADTARRTWSAEGTLMLPRTTLAELGRTLNVELPLDGLIEGDASFALTPDAPTAGGTLQLRYPILHAGDTDVELDQVKLAFALEHDTLTFTDGEIVYRDTPFSVTGAIALDPATRQPTGLDLRLHGQAVGLDRLTKYVESDDPLLGKLTEDLRIALPVDVEGRFDLEATVSAQLPPGVPFTTEALAKALTVSVTAAQVGELKLAGIPYQHFIVELEYRGQNEQITLRRLNLAREAGDRSYRIALPELDGQPVPATLNLATTEIDMNIALGSGRDHGNGEADDGADFDLLRRDLSAMTATFAPESPLGGLQAAVHALPLPFSGDGALNVTLAGAVQKPLITARITLNNLLVGGNVMPNIEGTLSYDTVPRVLTFDRLVATGGPDPDAVAELTGSATLPLKDRNGKDLAAGDMNLEFQAMNVDPSLIGLWMRNEQLQKITGQSTIVASIGGVTSNPTVIASLDVQHLAFGDLPFDTLSAILTLENDRLWIGRRGLEGEGAATLQFKGADMAPIEPLEIYGYLPIIWLGTLHPEVAADQPLYFRLNLPEQGLDVVKSYLPQLPEGAKTAATVHEEQAEGARKVVIDVRRSAPLPMTLLSESEKQFSLRGANSLAGSTRPAPAASAPKPSAPPSTADDHLLFVINGSGEDAIRISLPKSPTDAGHIRGSLEVRGTRLQPEIVNGVFLAEVPEIILPVTDDNLPNRLRDVSIDLGFHSTRQGNAWVNTLVVNDCSAIYDRDGMAPPRKPGKFEWLKKLLGTAKEDTPFRPGALVAGGTISFNLADARVLTPDSLDYDLYAKLLRAPLRWKDMLQGTITSYLHLGNNPTTHRPQIRGVVYAENGRMTYAGGGETEPSTPQLAFNPELQVAVQFGSGNVFEITPDNPLYQNTLSATLPFTATPLFSPIAVTDQPYLAGIKRDAGGVALVAKPPIDRDHPPYQYSAETLQPYIERGTIAWITGTLAQPTIEAHFVLVPGKSHVQLPGGSLTVREGTGRMVWRPFDDLAPEDRLQLIAKGEATGIVDKYTIAVRVDGNIMQDTRDGSPFQFVTLSSPQGMPPLSSSEIQARLTGLTSVADLLRGDRQIMSSLYERAPMYLFGGWFRKVADSLGLETFAFTFDQALTPEMTMVTSEFGKSRYGSFRLGWTRTYSDLPTWKLWGDYKMPDLKYIRNLSISADTNERGEGNVNLQYKFEF